MIVEVFFDELGYKCKLEKVTFINLTSNTLEYQTEDYIGKIPNVKCIRVEEEE